MLYLKGHSDRVRCVAYSPDGTMLASCGDDRTVRLWSLPSGRNRAILEGHSRTVYAVAFAPDNAGLATASGDQTVRIWERPEEGSASFPLKGHLGLVTSLAYSADGTALLSASGNSGPGELRVWSTADWTNRSLGVPTGVWSVDIAPDDDRFVALGLASKPGELWFLDREDLSRTLWRTSQESRVRALSFAPDGKTVASADGSSVRVWSMATERPPALKGHSSTVYGLAFAPDGRTLATASHDGTVRPWDYATHKERACFDWKIGKVDSVAFGPDGMTLAAGGKRDIVVWDVDSV